MSELGLFWPALLLVLALTVMLLPFGQVIIRRRVVFLDLAIGQWAAAGAAIGVLWLNNHLALWLGALLGALLAAGLVHWWSRRIQMKVALEAPIGLLYALGLSIFMLLQAHAGSQREVLAALVAYDILFTSAEQALWAALVAILVTLVWRRYPWFQQSGFYWLFALLCAFAVKLAGLLVVFVLLLAPALLAQYLRQVHRLGHVILTLLLSWVSLGWSLWADWPAGYTLVVSLSLLTLLVFMGYWYRHSQV